MSSVINAVAMGVAGGLLAKGSHIAIQEILGGHGAPEVAGKFQREHAEYSTPFKVMNICEHVLLIPFGEEGVCRALPAALTPNPLVNFAVVPACFGMMHYDPKQGDLNTPYVLSQISSGVIFAGLMKMGGFPAAFTAHAVSNLYTVICLLN